MSSTRTAPDEPLARALAALVPAGQPVVLAEPAGAALAEALAARGCEALDHATTDARAAAAVVDGALARIASPVELLTALAGRLAPAGFVVIAHPERAECAALLARAGLAIVHEQRVEAPPAWLMVAHPVPWKGLEWLQARLDESARAHELAEDLDSVNDHVTRLIASQEQLIARDATQRARMLELERELAQRDQRLIEMRAMPSPPSWLRYQFRLSIVGRVYRRVRRSVAAFLE